MDFNALASGSIPRTATCYFGESSSESKGGCHSVRLIGVAVASSETLQALSATTLPSPEDRRNAQRLLQRNRCRETRPSAPRLTHRCQRFQRLGFWGRSNADAGNVGKPLYFADASIPGCMSAGVRVAPSPESKALKTLTAMR